MKSGCNRVELKTELVFVENITAVKAGFQQRKLKNG